MFRPFIFKVVTVLAYIKSILLGVFYLFHLFFIHGEDSMTECKFSLCHWFPEVLYIYASSPLTVSNLLSYLTAAIMTASSSLLHHWWSMHRHMLFLPWRHPSFLEFLYFFPVTSGLLNVINVYVFRFLVSSRVSLSSDFYTKMFCLNLSYYNWVTFQQQKSFLTILKDRNLKLGY